MILPFKIVCIIDYLVLNLCLRLNLFFYIHTSVFYTSMLVFFTNKQVVFKSKGFPFLQHYHSKNISPNQIIILNFFI